MTLELVIVIILLAINLICALVYLISHIVAGRAKQGIAVCIFLLAFPVIGVLVMLLGEVLSFVFRRLQIKEIDPEDLSFSKERMHLAMPADVQKSLNTVAVEEALLMSGSNDRRQTFINVLKDDEQDNMLPLIRRSVENADPEVAHYAASYIDSALTNYKKKEAQYYTAMSADASTTNVKRYIEYVESIVNSGLFATLEMQNYSDRLVQAAETLYLRNPDDVSDTDIVNLVGVLKTLGREDARALWISRAHERAWTSLECFKLCASYFYSINDKERLFTLINQARRHSVNLDQESLTWIRLLETEAL